MKTFFKLSLLSAFCVVNLASAHNHDSARAALLQNNSQVAMNLGNALQFGMGTGFVTGVIGSSAHALAMRSGATAGQAAFCGLAAGGATGIVMSSARSQLIKDLMGSEYAGAGVIGGVATCGLTAALYLLAVGTPNAARANN